MRLISLWTMLLLTIAAAFVLSFPVASSAARMRPGGDCVFQRKIVANGRWCSHHCDRAMAVCAQQSCYDGRWITRINCVEPLCASRCGG